MFRREFIKVGMMAGGGLLLSLRASASTIDKAVLPAPLNASTAFGNFLKIFPDGKIHFQLTKHEMGQGVATSLAMILAEEMDADWEQIQIEFITADLAIHQTPKLGGYGTGGSTTVMDMYPILRTAGAGARYLLLQAAGKRWSVPPNECLIENGRIKYKDKEFHFGELVADAALIELPEEIPLKAEKNFDIIGTSRTGKLTPKIVTGQNTYGIDVKVRDMLYAVVARCPVYRGKLKNYDATNVMKMNGVKTVVTTKGVAGIKGHFQYDVREGVAVVATSFWVAKKAREALKIEWDEGVVRGKNIEDFERAVLAKSRQRIDPTGFIGDENAISNVREVRQTLRASYTYPYQLHSMMEPLNCTAHFKGDSCEVWVGTQAPHVMIRAISSHFQIPAEKITLHLLPSGGGFGRRWYPDTALEALCISREAGNVPVKMIWTREDDQTVNQAHCYVQSHYQASIDKDNKLHAWYQKELRSYTWGGEFANPELTWIGYDIPNIRYDFENLLEESLIQSCAWRSVVANAWAFGQECFVDEIAAHVKVDPLAFRLSLLNPGHEAVVGHSNTVNNDRLIRVLKVAAEKSAWGSGQNAGMGKGIAAYPYMHGNSYCAMVADVTVDGNKVKVVKITCAVDCGLVVNPSGVKNQIEGGIVWGLTALFYGGVNIQDGRNVNTNFHQNKLLRMDECPEIEIHFVDAPGQKPFGVGELAPPVVIPAVLNAVFQATGKRIRKLPVAL